TNDREIHITQPYLTVDHGRISSEFLLPQIVREHDHGVPTGNLVLIAPEGAPELGLNPEHAKEISAYQQSRLQLRLRLRILSKAGSKHVIDDKAIKRPALLLEVGEIRIGHFSGRPDH